MYRHLQGHRAGSPSLPLGNLDLELLRPYISAGKIWKLRIGRKWLGGLSVFVYRGGEGGEDQGEVDGKSRIRIGPFYQLDIAALGGTTDLFS